MRKYEYDYTEEFESKEMTDYYYGGSYSEDNDYGLSKGAYDNIVNNRDYMYDFT